MKKITNYQPGPRGINLKGGTTRWLEPGETAEIDTDDVVGELPDFGKPADQGKRDADELETLRARVADLEAELASYRAGKGGKTDEPGPLDQSVEKLTEYLKTVGDADQIQKLIDAETAGKSRAGVLSALKERQDAILAA